MKLRDYESRSVRDLLKLLQEHRSVVAVGPTGAGKTVIGAAVVRQLGKVRVLWLAHRYELLNQARSHLLEVGVKESQVGLLSGTRTINRDGRIMVASVDMFRSRLVPEVDLIVVDEAHHATAESYRNIIDVHKGALVLGLTATPERLDGEPLGDVFAHMYNIAEAFELIDDGYLLRAAVYGIPRDKARELVRNADSGREYSSIKLDEAMRKRPLMADIVNERFRLARHEPTLVYAVSRLHGKELYYRFGKSGVKAAYVDALTPAHQRNILLGPNGKLAQGLVEVVVNVGLVTEGFDCPAVNCVVVARPTKSLTLWRQMCGRGARPRPGRRSYLVLDHAGNVWRHGFPDTPIAWSLTGRERASGEQPFKVCGACKAINPLAATECRECGAAFPLTERELAEQKAELERVEAIARQKREAEERVRALAAERGFKESFVSRVMMEMFPEARGVA